MKHTLFTLLFLCAFGLTAQQKHDLKLSLDTNKVYYRSIGVIRENNSTFESGSVLFGQNEEGLEVSTDSQNKTVISFRRFDLSYHIKNISNEGYAINPIFLDFEGGYNEEKETTIWFQKGDMTSGFNAFTKKGLQINIDKLGRIEDLYYKSEMLKEIVGITNLSIDELEKSASDKYVKLILGSLLNIFPEKPVAIGEKWENNIKDLTWGEIMMTLELLEVNDETYIIGLKSRIDEGRKVKSKSIVKIKSVGTILGKIEITKDGWVKEGIIYERANEQRISQPYRGWIINPETNTSIVKETHIQGWSTEIQAVKSANK